VIVGQGVFFFPIELTNLDKLKKNAFLSTTILAMKFCAITPKLGYVVGMG
jgi:hypothetical protein